MERIDKIIGNTHRYTRRDARRLIREGLVLKNGDPVRSLDEKASKEDVIAVDGEVLERKHRMAVALNKMAGYVTTMTDKEGPSVMHLLPPSYAVQELFPVGRLDKDTEGLLILTNDGELAHRLISPKKDLLKAYYAEFEGCISPEDIQKIEEGLHLKDGDVKPAKIRVLGEGRAILSLTEGKYHQVRRMLASLGHPVSYLRRVQEGAFVLSGLQPGEFRVLSEDEIQLLEQNSGLLVLDVERGGK